MSSTSKTKKPRNTSQAAPSRSGHPDTPPESPTLQSGVLDLATYFLDTVNLIHSSESKGTSVAGPQLGGNTEPVEASSTLPPGKFELAKEIIETVKLIQASQSTSDSKETSLYAGPQAEGNVQPQEARVRASKLEYKEVDEVYVP